MKRSVIVAIALACGVGAVLADTDPIAERRALMKNDGMRRKRCSTCRKARSHSIWRRCKAFLRRRSPTGATKTPALFPDNSKTGGGTAALPAIWQNKADFNARFAKFAKDVAAAQAGIVDEATFKKFAPAVFQNCGGCHELYKAKSG